MLFDVTRDAGADSEAQVWRGEWWERLYDRDELISTVYNVAYRRCECWESESWRAEQNWNWESLDACHAEQLQLGPWSRLSEEQWTRFEADTTRRFALACVQYISDRSLECWYSGTQTECSFEQTRDCDLAVESVLSTCGGFTW